MSKSYLVTYRNPSSPSRGQQKMVILSDSAHNAARQFAEQFPQLRLVSLPTEVRR
jgi:hypothetical protein